MSNQNNKFSPEVRERFFRPGGARPRPEEVNAYIDQHRDLYGVEPICKMLQVAPSAYWRHAARCRNPERRSQRAKKDERLMVQIQRVWEQNFRVYGARKVWKQLNREGVTVARCTVERLMRRLGIEGVRRGKRVRTTVPDGAAACPRDLVKRHSRPQAPKRNGQAASAAANRLTPAYGPPNGVPSCPKSPTARPDAVLPH
ncbi:hypothetical protein HNQ49_004366 [Parapusillimonas granuli]|nr:hypothetical protein [Parapusillimonas granuli]